MTRPDIGVPPTYPANTGPQPTLPPPYPTPQFGQQLIGAGPQVSARWTRGKLAIASAVVASAAVIGGLVGGFIVHRAGADNTTSPGNPPAISSPAAPSAGDTHVQDVALCTSYAVINSAIPRPYESGADLLPAAAALQQAVAASPGASAEIRFAMTGVVDAFYSRIAEFGEVRRRGLAEPPAYSNEHVQTAYDRAWSVCQLDR